MNAQIFSRRLTRRDFLKTSGLAAAALAVPQALNAKSNPPVVRIGAGSHTYEWVEGWGALPSGMDYGFGCGIVADSKDRIYVLTRTRPGLIVFDRQGRFLEIWEEDVAHQLGISAEPFAKSAHGLYWSREGKKEFLYFTENKPGNRVTKTDLNGNVLLRIGRVHRASSTSIPFQFDNPTDVAISGNGDIYVVDGYGSQLVHRFSKQGRLIRTIGGRGAEHGRFNICHGVWINSLRNEPEVYIADRANHRIEVYSLDLDYRRTIEGFRLPCCFYQQGRHLFVPELGSRVSILDGQDNLVARLGDGGEEKRPDKDKDPAIFATPHALTVDSRGDLYVLEWLPYARLRKFRHTPQRA